MIFNFSPRAVPLSGVPFCEGKSVAWKAALLLITLLTRRTEEGFQFAGKVGKSGYLCGWPLITAFNYWSQRRILPLLFVDLLHNTMRLDMEKFCGERNGCDAGGLISNKYDRRLSFWLLSSVIYVLQRTTQVISRGPLKQEFQTLSIQRFRFILP